MLNEEKMTAYQKFFMKALEKFGVSSPAEFKSDDEKKKFFDYVDKNWTGEKSEEVEAHSDIVSEANAFLKTRAAAIWEGNDEFEFNGKIYPVIKIREETVDESTRRIQSIKPNSPNWYSGELQSTKHIRGKTGTKKFKIGDSILIHPFDEDRFVAAVDKNDRRTYFLVPKYSVGFLYPIREEEE